jgi:hypothetical protein
MISNIAPNLAFFGTKFCTFHADKLKAEEAKPKAISQQNKQLHANCAQGPFWQTTCNKIQESNYSFLLRAPAAYLSGWFFLALIT